MKAYGGRSRGIAPLIRNFGSSWKWLVSFMPLPRHFRRKCCRCALGRKLGGPYSLYRRFVFCLCRMVQSVGSTCADRGSWVIVVMLLTAVIALSRRSHDLLIMCNSVLEVLVKLNATIKVNPTPFKSCTASRVSSLRHPVLLLLFRP
jgi:hypothetical protein